MVLRHGANVCAGLGSNVTNRSVRNGESRWTIIHSIETTTFVVGSKAHASVTGLSKHRYPSIADQHSRATRLS